MDQSKGIFYLINLLANFLSLSFQASKIIFAEFLFNLLGIAAVFCCAKILRKSDIYKNRALYNLIIVTFCVGYFLRVFALQFNEYLTYSSLFIAISFVHISYYFLGKSCLKKTGFYLSAIIFLSVIFFFNQFASRVVVSGNWFSYFEIIKTDLFPIILLICFSLSFINPKAIPKPLVILFILGCLVLFCTGNIDYVKRAVFYSLAMSLIVVMLFLLLKEKKINWKSDGLFFLLCLFVPQFDPQVFFNIALDLVIFWWVLVLINAFQRPKLHKRNLLTTFFLPYNFNSWACFAALVINSISLSIIDKSGQISWSISAAILTILIIFYEKNNHLDTVKSAQLSRISTIVIAMILSYLLNLNLVAIFNHKNIYAYDFKSPNYVSKIEADLIRELAPNENQNVIILANSIKDIYPVFYYFNKTNQTNYGDAESMKSKIKDQNPKLIFVEKRADSYKECYVGFLENYFRDASFKRFFLKNYKFVNRIVETRELKPQVSFFASEVNYNQDSIIIIRDIEIYEKN